MSIKFKTFTTFILLLTAGAAFPLVAAADTKNPNSPTTQTAFENAYFRHDKNFYENNSLGRQISSFLGIGGAFPENEIAKDAELVNTLYRDVLAQQTTNDKYIRTQDLPNPYEYSLFTSPGFNKNKLKLNTEYGSENLPSR